MAFRSPQRWQGLGFSLIDCSPEALRVGGLVRSIYGEVGTSALVLLVSCLGQSLAARALLSFLQFECCRFSDLVSFAYSVVLHVFAVRNCFAP